MMYFFDSYAIIEIVEQNKGYLKYSKERIVTNVIHLAEFYYYLLKKTNKKIADLWIDNLKFEFIDISPEISIKASIFKFENRKKDISYADCLGYITSLKYNMKFLTGDKEFKNLKNVEFVK